MQERSSESRRVYAFGLGRAKLDRRKAIIVIIQRYVVREILQKFISVLVLLLVIFASFSFVKFLTQAAVGTLSSALIFELLVLSVVGKLPLLIPLAVYAAVLVSLGRLSSDSEIVAMTAGGIGMGRIVVAVFWMAAAVCVLSMVLSLYVAPKVNLLRAELYAQAKDESEFTLVYPGRFKTLRGGELTLYVESISDDGRVMQQVFAQLLKDDREDIIVAARARKQVEGAFGRQYIVAEDGHRYTGRAGDVDYEVTRFASHGFLVDQGSAEPTFRKQDAYPTMELLRSDRAVHQAAFQARLSKPISIVLLALLAIPLARTSPRQGKYSKLFTAFLVYFAYNNGVAVFQKFIERGDIPPVVGVWPVHLTVIVLITVLLMSQSLAPGYVRRGFHRVRPAR